MVGPNKIDIPAMISQIEQAITDGADGIITCPLDPAAFKGVIDEAKSKGIIVASIGCVDPNATFSVGTGNEQYGRVSADLINEQTGGNAQVGIVGTDQTHAEPGRAGRRASAPRSRTSTPTSRKWSGSRTTATPASPRRRSARWSAPIRT